MRTALTASIIDLEHCRGREKPMCVTHIGSREQEKRHGRRITVGKTLHRYRKPSYIW